MVNRSKSVLILMTTYNGAEYIKEQIESIINQSNSNWTLIIRDDGSKDGTVKIIKKTCVNPSRINFIENSSERHGAYLNFWSLVHYAKMQKDYDYYFFSDQDDVWLPDKIESMIGFDKEQGKNEVPRLIYADMQVIDRTGNLVYESLNSIMGIGEMTGVSLFFTHGFLWGCDILLNKALFDIVPPLPLDNSYIDIMSHDNYFGKFALLFGEIKYFQKVCIQHRRHGKNETGSYQIKMTFFSALKQALTRWNELAKTHARVYTQTLITISQIESAGLANKNTQEIKEAIERGGLKGILILKKCKVKRKQKVRTLGIYLIMLTKKYKMYMGTNCK